MKKMKILALVMVMAFAAIGGASALWFDTLRITETVTTGTVDVDWVAVGSTDPAPNFQGASTGIYDPSLDTMDPDNPNDSKNVGYKDIPFDADALVITMHNVYPGYQEAVVAAMKNLGTIPVKLEVTTTGSGVPEWLRLAGAGLLIDDLPVIIDGTTYSDIQSIVDAIIVAYDSTTGNTDEVKAFFEGLDGILFLEDIEGLQIDPDQYLIMLIIQRVRQIAPQGNVNGEAVEAAFGLSFKAVQWNEYLFQGRDGDAGEMPDVITFPRIINLQP